MWWAHANGGSLLILHESQIQSPEIQHTQPFAQDMAGAMVGSAVAVWQCQDAHCHNWRDEAHSWMPYTYGLMLHVEHICKAPQPLLWSQRMAHATRANPNSFRYRSSNNQLDSHQQVIWADAHALESALRPRCSA
jgi:hypothetical protein